MARTKQITRCGWCGNDELYTHYHDQEWGVPQKDDNTLFELLTLEGAQAGLSWITILRKRENYRQAFANFNPEKIINFTDQDVARLMENKGIVRNRLKIQSVIKNAALFQDVKNQHGSFSKYLWDFVDGKPITNRRKTLSEIPATSEISDKISKDMKKRGFKFVGSTIIYAFMQATGMVNDHLVDCFRYQEINKTTKTNRI